jgi:hypothetical protein
MTATPLLEHPGSIASTFAPPPCSTRHGLLHRAATWLVGWAWRVLIGSWFCLNPLTALIVVGWLCRRIQSRVLYGWWKQARRDDTFAEFCRTLGSEAPVLRPRWFLREANRPKPSGSFRRALHIVTAPVASLWLNLRLGFVSLFCTELLLGFGCLTMAWSWWYGWLNSFHKGYENYLVGPLSGVGGVILFTAAMMYVPMAQVHQAVIGEARAFFDFRFVWRLVRSRPTGYLGLALLFLFFGVVLEILKTAPAFLPQADLGSEPTDAELRGLAHFLENYYFACAVVLFVALLLTRLAAARVYRLAVLHGLRTGRITRADLHPRLADWLDRLGLLMQPTKETGVWPAVRETGRWGYHRVVYVALALVWIAFAAKGYVGEFLHVHPIAGFLNQPLVQLPFCTSVPGDLEELAKK